MTAEYKDLDPSCIVGVSNHQRHFDFGVGFARARKLVDPEMVILEDNEEELVYYSPSGYRGAVSLFFAVLDTQVGKIAFELDLAYLEFPKGGQDLYLMAIKPERDWSEEAKSFAKLAARKYWRDVLAEQPVPKRMVERLGLSGRQPSLSYEGYLHFLSNDIRKILERVDR